MNILDGLYGSFFIALGGGIIGVMLLYDNFAGAIAAFTISGGLAGFVYLVGFTQTMKKLEEDSTRNLELMEFLTDYIDSKSQE